MSARSRKSRKTPIKIAPDISEVTADGAVFADGSKVAFDAIIFATGYRANYSAFLQGNDGAETLGDGPVNKPARVPASISPGCGIPPAGLLRDIAKEAVLIADDIVRRRRESASRAS